jgi:hypothetical protein
MRASVAARISQGLIGLLLAFTNMGCIGRAEWGTSYQETYGHPGDRVWAIIGHNIGGVPVGVPTATVSTVQVKVGPTTLSEIMDVLDVKSTRHGFNLRVVAFQVPNVAPGRYLVQILHNNTEVDWTGRYYLTVLPD